MFFVAGITGHVGGAAARALLEQGHRVRTLARDPAKAADWASQGVEVREGDLVEAGVLAAALDGVEGAFLLIPPTLAPMPGFPEAQAVIASYVDALGRMPPPRLVALSSFGSEKPSGLGLITSTYMMEQALGGLRFPVAFVRAGGFIENNLFGLGRAAETRVFDTFYAPTGRGVPTVATADVGREVARLLIGGWSGRKIVEVGDYVSPDDLARAMGGVLGRTVEARSMPREHWGAVLAGMGLPEGRGAPYEEMMDGVNSGWIDFGAPGAERVAGSTTPAEVFARARS